MFKLKNNMNKETKVPTLSKTAFISRYFTLIKVKRDHSTRSGFFIVNVSESQQYGFGFTRYIKGVVYGFSVHNNGL